MSVVSGCGSGDSGDPPRDLILSMNLSRGAGTEFCPVNVTVSARDAGGVPRVGLVVMVESSRGTVSAVSDNGDGTYAATVHPDSAFPSGEYRITASSIEGGSPVSATALVLKTVSAGFGQPMAVPGDYVNTAGWEDSINVTRDGKWLFMMYSPMSIGGYFAGAPSHDWAKYAAGPWKSPRRPDFPAARISDEGEITHSFPRFCDTAPGMVVQPVTMYGFRRQQDGIFGEPFLVAIVDSGNNDVMGEFGPNCIPLPGGGLRMAFSFFDPQNAQQRNNIYYADIVPGSKQVLGEFYNAASCPAVDLQRKNVVYDRVKIEAKDANDKYHHLMDPHLITDGDGEIKTVMMWIQEDENETSPNIRTRAIYAFTLKSGKAFPGTIADDWQALRLPPPVNYEYTYKDVPFYQESSDTEDYQPHFTGDCLYFNRDNNVVRSAYKDLGGGYGDTASWGSVKTVLAGEPAEIYAGDPLDAAGRIIALGEPTLCEYGGKKYLYFVYGIVTDYDPALKASGKLPFNIDLNAGFVEIAE